MKWNAYIIKRETPFDGYDCMGTPIGELLISTFAGRAETVEVFDSALAGEYVACLYSDTPLVEPELLDGLVADMEEQAVGAVAIGDGEVRRKGYQGNAIKLKDAIWASKITDLEVLSDMTEYRRDRIVRKHLRAGVLIMGKNTVWIGDKVRIGKNVVIHPFNILKGETVIGDDAVVYGYCDLDSVEIGEHTDIRSTYALQTKIGAFSTIGPFATLRKGAVIGSHCRVGDYVEIKNSTLEDGVKAAHLAYVGDSFVGSNTNIGCGSIFANYDGKVKRSVIVGKDVFIGCNSNLVAPLEIEDGAYIAAGSTVTQNVPGNTLCIARARQVHKGDWERPRKHRN